MFTRWTPALLFTQTAQRNLFPVAEEITHFDHGDLINTKQIPWGDITGTR